MSIKLIFLDLDGTLLSSEKEISPRTREVLDRAVNAGIHIVPSTGRFYDGVPQVVQDLPFIRYAVTVNGAQIYDIREKKVLHQADISPETADKVFSRLDQLPVIYDSFINGWGYMDEALYNQIDQFIQDPHVNKMVKDLRKPIPSLREYVRRNMTPVQKIQMFFNDMAERQAAWNSLVREFPQMAITSSIVNNLEINDLHANKGEALRFLAKHLGIDIQETMSFGDGSNDRSMIEAAGVGVAMGNATPALKSVANYVTDTNDQDGVAKVIEKFCFQQSQFP